MSNIRAISPKHAELIDTLEMEEDVYTNKGRLNKSALSKKLGLKAKEIDDLFYDCQREFAR